MQDEKKVSAIIFNNLKELVKAKNTAHESMFKFHWKKMWPFSLIWPQVDFIRITRFMESVKAECFTQKQFIIKNKSNASTLELEFLNAVLPYLDALSITCENLGKVANYRQALLEKRETKDAFKYNAILKDYENAAESLVRAGAFVQMAWGALKSTQG